MGSSRQAGRFLKEIGSPHWTIFATGSSGERREVALVVAAVRPSLIPRLHSVALAVGFGSRASNILSTATARNVQGTSPAIRRAPPRGLCFLSVNLESEGNRRSAAD